MTIKKDKFKELYIETQSFVRASVFWLAPTLDRDQLDDIVQETYLKSWRNFDQFKGSSHFKTWIYAIGKNTTIDYLKKNSPKNFIVFDDTETTRNEDLEMLDLIDKGIMSLEIKLREVFILFYKLELSIKEIQEVLSLKEGTVKSRLHSARKEFENFLNSQEIEEGVEL